MGVLPLQYRDEQTRESLGLTGLELFDVAIDDAVQPRQLLQVTATHPETGKVTMFQAQCRIDTPVEVDYYKNGGILQTVLRKLLAETAGAVKPKPKPKAKPKPKPKPKAKAAPARKTAGKPQRAAAKSAPAARKRAQPAAPKVTGGRSRAKPAPKAARAPAPRTRSKPGGRQPARPPQATRKAKAAAKRR
jgi:hypothetical protein